MIVKILLIIIVLMGVYIMYVDAQTVEGIDMKIEEFKIDLEEYERDLANGVSPRFAGLDLAPVAPGYRVGEGGVVEQNVIATPRLANPNNQYEQKSLEYHKN